MSTAGWSGSSAWSRSWRRTARRRRSCRSAAQPGGLLQPDPGTVEAAAPEAEEPAEAEEAPAEPDRRSGHGLWIPGLAVDEDEEEVAETERRRWPAVLAIVVLGIAAVIGILALLGLLPSRHDLSDLVPGWASSSSTSTAGLPLVGPPPAPLTATGTSTGPPGHHGSAHAAGDHDEASEHDRNGDDDQGNDNQAGDRHDEDRDDKDRDDGAATTKAATTKPPATLRPSAIQPARTWAWAPVPKATYYTIEFRRGTKRIYQTVSSKPRLTLPSSVVFSAGAYRWIVRRASAAAPRSSSASRSSNSVFSVA